MGPTNVVAKTQNDLGVYRGYFATALTPDPADDLNYNPCDERVADCTRHQAPLIDILLQLSENDEGRLQATFFRNLADLQAGDSGGCDNHSRSDSAPFRRLFRQHVYHDHGRPWVRDVLDATVCAGALFVLLWREVRRVELLDR